MKYLKKQFAQGIKNFLAIKKTCLGNNDNFSWGRAQVPHVKRHLL
jgi:hypothetical protein